LPTGWETVKGELEWQIRGRQIRGSKSRESSRQPSFILAPCQLICQPGRSSVRSPSATWRPGPASVERQHRGRGILL